MRFDVRRLRALRRAHPVASLIALISTATIALAGTLAAVALAGSSEPVARAAPAPTPSIDDGAVSGSPIDEWADFRALQRKPAASAPIHRLPKIRLATVSVDGIPPVPLAAYRAAAHEESVARPDCHLPWWLLAGIGFVESGHARAGGSTHVGWRGVARPPIYGPVLDGRHGYKAIPDTDDGVLDGDRHWDRAVGPMQFLPSTWRTWGPPGHLDGRANPQSIRAAATAAASYLCASGSDIAQPHAMALAVYSYNHSFGYVRLVLSVAARYAGMTRLTSSASTCCPRTGRARRITTGTHIATITGRGRRVRAVPIARPRHRHRRRVPARRPRLRRVRARRRSPTRCRR